MVVWTRCCLAEITAYQTSPPYDALKGGEIITEAKVGLPGTYLVDLVAEADGDAHWSCRGGALCC